MAIKWKEDYSTKAQRIFGLVIGLAVGALATGVAFGCLWKCGERGANPWEVLATLGTIGATVTALWFGLKAERNAIKMRQRSEVIHWKVFQSYCASSVGAAGIVIEMLELIDKLDANKEIDIYILDSLSRLRGDLCPDFLKNNIDKFVYLSDEKANAIAEIVSHGSLLSSVIGTVIRCGVSSEDLKRVIPKAIKQAGIIKSKKEIFVK